MLLTTTCFGPQVAIIRLYVLKLILSAMHIRAYNLVSSLPYSMPVESGLQAVRSQPAYCTAVYRE